MRIIKNFDGKFIYLFITSIVILFNQSCKKQEIAQWRGMDRSGHYDETQIMDFWPENGPQMLWSIEGLGKGFAAPVIQNDHIFINGEIDNISYLFAYNTEGLFLWKTPNGPEFTGSGFSSTYPGSRSTPTVMGDLIYTTSGTGRIACIEASSGKEVWAIDLMNQLQGSLGEFGYSESVVVDETKVYCFPGGDKINLAALDRFNGKTVWTSEALRDTFAYCSPVKINLPAKNILVTTSRHYLFAVDCETGQALGRYFLEGYEYDGEHCNSPVYQDGSIYFIANDEKGKGAVRLGLSDDGETITETWYNKKIRNNFNGFVTQGDFLYTTVEGNWLKALSLADGKVGDSVRVATGSIVAADQKLICYGMNGDVNLVKHEENGLEIKGSFKVSQGNGHHFSYPVLAGGVMYIRHGDALMAYQLKK